MKHLAIIADGNRRWARNNGFPLKLGYSQGLVAIERSCEWAIENNVQYLSFYCFSTENWQRSEEEVNTLFDLADLYFGEKTWWYIKKNIRVVFAGRRDRFSLSFKEKIQNIEQATKAGSALTLIIYADYGGRDEVARAIASGATTEEQISRELAKISPEPDVILRTGGEKRLSNFMLWQAAYAELFFLDVLFPDLTSKVLDLVKSDYNNRKRNFGK